MNPSLMRLLVCPACHAELELGITRRRGEHVLEGNLTCRTCARSFPVRRGVPRFVEDQAYTRSFGLQWNAFATVQLDSYSGTDESAVALDEVVGWPAFQYRGRRILDVGVGAGRFAEVAAARGGEVVGLDLSNAVDAAYRNLDERVQLVQADLFAMPFRPGTFDLAYSIGVLHHTPDTRRAFHQVADTVKADGTLAVYVYSRYGWAHRAADLLRIITTRLPQHLMLALTALAIVMHPLYRLPVVGRLLQLICPISPHPNWRWRWLDTFDWYTPRYQWKFLYPEVAQWFRETGFDIVSISGGSIRMAGRRRTPAVQARSA